jgi:hypothetical protein
MQRTHSQSSLSILGRIGLLNALFILFLGCSSCNGQNVQSADERNRRAYQEQIHFRRTAKCQELLNEGDIASLRAWCDSTEIRESVRRNICQIVAEYDALCTLVHPSP